jgi:mono/diheme cytochrome c family protein
VEFMMIRTIGAAVMAVGWLAASASAQSPAQLEKGKQVYAAQKCQACHSIQGVGNKKGVLDDVGSRASRDEIRQWIVNAPEMTARTKAARKPAMKAYPAIGKEDLDALVDYLHGLKAKS